MNYETIKTGQDMINAGIKPKTSSETIALITQKRLIALRDKINSGLTEQTLGEWIPLFTEKKTKLSDIADDESKLKYLSDGVKIKGAGSYEGVSLDGLEGMVKNVLPRSKQILIELDKPLELPISKTVTSLWVNPPNIRITDRRQISEYAVANNVVADEKIGHKITFDDNYTIVVPGRGLESDQRLKFTKGTVGTLTKLEQDGNNYTVQFRIDSVPGEELPDAKAKTEYKITVGSDSKILKEAGMKVSSLGQISPKNKEEEVRKKSLTDFFPKTKFDAQKAERIIIGLLMGRDMIFHGPPGGGKSSVAKDIVKIYGLTEIIFSVEGCDVQCNPYSLFDPEFAKKVNPCPECMIRYDESFKDTGIFHRPKPEDVKVVVKKFGDGMGMEIVEGTIGITRMHLAGYKMPKLDGTTDEKRESDYDPEGFRPGALPRTNNGLLLFEEMDKLRTQTLDDLLIALEDEIIKPDQLRFSYPANSIIIGTANDAGKFTDAINDRMLLISIRYPTDAETSYDITRAGYYKLFAPAKDTPISDIHVEKGNNFRKIPIPEPIERAVDTLYLKFRAEYTGVGLTPVSGSNRSKFDALDAARANWLLDSLFLESAPDFPDAEYAMKGINYALCSRVHDTDPKTNHDSKFALGKWVWENYPELLKAEENTWWCKTKTAMAVTAVKIPEVIANYTSEIKSYSQDINTTVDHFNSLKRAYEKPSDKKAQLTRIEYPFMDYLFRNQPNFAILDEEQMKGIVSYYLKDPNLALN